MNDLLRTLLRPGLPVLALLALLAPAEAQFTEGGTTPNGGGSTSSPGEDIGTVPATHDDPDDTLDDLGSTLVLVGRPREIGMALQDVTGSGLLSFSPFRPGAEHITVRISGDANVRLDARAVNAYGIGVYMEVDERASWVAQVGIGDWTSRRFQVAGGRRIPVPLTALRPWQPGPVLIDAANRDARAHLRGSLVGSSYYVSLHTRN